MIGKRIYELRREKKLTQSKLSELADISREQINRYENEKATPDFGTVVRIAKALEVSVNSLLHGPAAEKEITEEDIRYALGAGDPLTPKQYDEVKMFSAFVQERDRCRGQRNNA